MIAGVLAALPVVHAKPSDAAISRALFWAKSLVGQAAFPFANGVGSCPSPNMCSVFVANAYGSPAPSFDAYNLWCLLDQHPGDWSAPPGSLVFFDRTPDNALLGHVALCTGNGNLVQAGYARIKTGKIRYESAAGYLGWAWPPSIWPGRNDSSAAGDLVCAFMRQALKSVFAGGRT